MRRLTLPVDYVNHYQVVWGSVRGRGLYGVWYHIDLPPVAIRWVLIRDLRGEREPSALPESKCGSGAFDAGR